ncbi:Zinc finger protein CONSTANS-LIKE 2 [Abeliophyllum distichum]|uniref:Zinc finger protein CONSTANS-LIKE 2 n=1 Tax=Abeliophyllum distichum TaxID=126358 RepID=A0ABD1SJC9_9LAMI
MLKENGRGIHGGNTSNHWARICDTCQSAVCTVYCRADSAYLCTGCDARIHAASPEALYHERIWVCEASECAPAAFLCKADAASLCTTCDSDIHSANPLAGCHHRVPILPIPSMLCGTHPSGFVMGPTGIAAKIEFLTQDDDETIHEEEDEDETASWLLFNPVKNINNQSNKIGQFFGGEVDDYLDLDKYNSCQDIQFSNQDNNQLQHYNVSQKSYGSDNVVPTQFRKSKDQIHNHSFQLGLEYETLNNGYDHPASISHANPQRARFQNPSPRPQKGITDLFSSPPIPMPTQLTPMDREARVLRYREKKKARKFEKTIRYASRKAYAETRPRVKGRFAKRTDVGAEQMFSTTLIEDGGYGIVPSF